MLRWYSALALTSAVTIVVIVKKCTNHSPWDSNLDHSYSNNDYPMTWPITLANVGLQPEDTQRYALDTPMGALEWKALVSCGDGTISLGPNHRRFTVAMFHQLKCLDIIRQELVAPSQRDGHTTESPSHWELTEHCMNYLRQISLCHGNTALESVRSDQSPKITDLHRTTYECRDWSAMYAQYTESECAEQE